MNSIIAIMRGTSIVGLALALAALISLVVYVMGCVVKPILIIAESCKPLRLW